jgi:N-acetyl-alpha-D-glucosaminyl L-malate synthase BshA
VKIGITCYPTYGGSGVVATELGMALARRGHEIHFIAYALPFRLSGYDARVFFHAVEVMAYPLFEHPPYAVALAARMAQVAEAVGLDVLHVHYAVPHAVSAYLAKQILGGRGPLTVTTLHGTDITLVGNDPSLHPVTRFAIEASDAVTSVSTWLRDQTRRAFGTRREIAVIPNFVDTARFAPRREEALRARFAPGGERLLVHLSNFRPLKRVGDVIRAFALVRRRLAARLLLVGDGVERPRVLDLARDLGIEKDVVDLSKQEEVACLLAQADLFLLPSEQESFGLAALEAMSCGVPIIATRVGGLPELVAEGESGRLFAVGDVEGMAAEAVAILEDEERLARMRAAARRSAIERFDAERIVPMYEQFYQASLEGRRR